MEKALVKAIRNNESGFIVICEVIETGELLLMDETALKFQAKTNRIYSGNIQGGKFIALAEC